MTKKKVASEDKVSTEEKLKIAEARIKLLEEAIHTHNQTNMVKKIIID